MCLYNLVSKTGTIRDKDFQLLLALLLLLVQHLVVRVQTSLTLSLASLGSHANPFQLTLKGLTAFAGYLLLLSHTLGFLLQPRRVVALPGYSFSTIQFQNPSCHII